VEGVTGIKEGGRERIEWSEKGSTKGEGETVHWGTIVYEYWEREKDKH